MCAYRYIFHAAFFVLGGGGGGVGGWCVEPQEKALFLFVMLEDFKGTNVIQCNLDHSVHCDMQLTCTCICSKQRCSCLVLADCD